MTGLPKLRLTSSSRLALSALLIAAAATGLSAHVVRGLYFPTMATAFVSSPTGAADAPVAVRWGAVDAGLRIVCFNVANTSPARADRPDWPRVTGAGFELPGTLTGSTTSRFRSSRVARRSCGRAASTAFAVSGKSRSMMEREV